MAQMHSKRRNHWHKSMQSELIASGAEQDFFQWFDCLKQQRPRQRGMNGPEKHLMIVTTVTMNLTANKSSQTNESEKVRHI